MNVLSFGLDWYTATNIVQDSPECQSLFSVFHDLSECQKRWRSGGYKGQECLITGIKYGSRIRKDGRADEMLVASGSVSNAVVDRIGDVSRFRATRIDIQITLYLDARNTKLASDLYDATRMREGFGRSPLGNRKMSLIRSGPGDTLYLGSRSSARKFFRLYDKSIDLGHKKGQIWRCEIQYGRELAQAALRWYDNVWGVEHAVVDLVCSEFFDAFEWSPLSKYQYNSQLFLAEDKEETKLAKKLTWLRDCVRPTAKILIDNGLEEEARAALGLPGEGDWTRRDMNQGDEQR